jgi:hypothetical protein
MADGRSFELPKSSTIFILGDILCGVTSICHCTLSLALLAIKKTWLPKISPVVAVVMLSFYATFVFAYAGVYTGHLLSGIFALTGYIFPEKEKLAFIWALWLDWLWLPSFRWACWFPCGLSYIPE